MKISRVVMLAVFGLPLGGFSEDSARDAAPPRGQEFVVELDPRTDLRPGTTGGVRIVEHFRSADKTYVVYEAESADVLAKDLERVGLSPKKVSQVRDINSPTRGGGKPAGDQPRPGQTTFVIERKIPGVGTFPDAKKQAISRKSNAAIAEIGDSIEWVHSYLTDEGTYCLYRATDEDTIRKHGAIAGAPITKVSEARVVSVH
jgi:hypothetical protein